MFQTGTMLPQLKNRPHAQARPRGAPDPGRGGDRSCHGAVAISGFQTGTLSRHPGSTSSREYSTRHLVSVLHFTACEKFFYASGTNAQSNVPACRKSPCLDGSACGRIWHKALGQKLRALSRAAALPGNSQVRGTQRPGRAPPVLEGQGECIRVLRPDAELAIRRIIACSRRARSSGTAAKRASNSGRPSRLRLSVVVWPVDRPGFAAAVSPRSCSADQALER